MYIEYRLASEHSVWRSLIINKSDNFILAEELYSILYKESNINYSNKIDIYLSIFKNEHCENRDNGQNEYLKGDEKIYTGTRILVHRKIKQKILATDICHDAKKEILINKEEEKKKVSLPIEFLCKLCNYLLNESYIIVCSNNCGYSVCKNCIIFYIFQIIIREDEKKNNIIDISLLNQKIKCPLCEGFLKYCILNKKLELTLKTLKEERTDVNAYDLSSKHIINKYYRIVENLKIQNFDYSNKNIFEHEVLKTIEKKFIYLNVDVNECKTQDKLLSFVKPEFNEDTSHVDTGMNDEKQKLNKDKLNEQKQNNLLNLFAHSEENNVFNTLVYLLESHKLNCIKEHELIYVDFDSVIFDSIKRISVKNSQYEIKDETLLNDVKKKNIKGAGPNVENGISENGPTGKKEEIGDKEVKKQPNLKDLQFDNNKIYFIPLSFVGGETSYSMIGIVCIKELFVISKKSSIRTPNKKKDENSEEDKKKIAHKFLTKWFMNEQIKKDESILEKLYNGNIYKIDYFIKYEKTCFFPAKKQPLYNIIHNKRQKKKKSDLEIVVDQKKFKEIICCVDDYIQFGSRPFQDDMKKNVVLNNLSEEERKNNLCSEKMEGNNIPNHNMSASSCLMGHLPNDQKEVNKIKNTIGVGSSSSTTTNTGNNFDNINNSNLKMNDPQVREMLEIMYGTKLAPLSPHNNFDINNPYLGYCALLPFLKKEEFDLIRDLQRICKETYLKRLYKHVKKNNLNMNIFYTAVHSVFFLHKQGMN